MSGNNCRKFEFLSVCLLMFPVFSAMTLKTDVWTKKGLSQSFLEVTAHFLLSNNQRHRVALAVCLFPGSHTAVKVRALLTTILKQWKIPAKKNSNSRHR